MQKMYYRPADSQPVSASTSSFETISEIKQPGERTQADTIALLAGSLQSGKTPEELGAEVFEPNYDLDSVYQLMGMNDSDGRAIAVYRLYLDGSGKVIRDESGKMTEENPERTEKRVSGEGM